ncbi:MAG: hypothetical protein KDA37_07970 [Planctomycetales bacterium]|nr:hypothetical protein [Planctomycetales bacterium]
MPIRFQCGNCGAGFKAADEHAGHQLPCPKCGSEMRVPADQAIIAPQDDPLDETESSGLADTMIRKPSRPTQATMPPVPPPPPPPPLRRQTSADDSPIAAITKGGGADGRAASTENDGKIPIKSLILPTIGLLAGIVVGGIVGYFAAHFFPFWGGLALLGEPYSDARYALVPGHVLLCSLLLGSFGLALSIIASRVKL